MPNKEKLFPRAADAIGRLKSVGYSFRSIDQQAGASPNSSANVLKGKESAVSIDSLEKIIAVEKAIKRALK